MPNVTSLKIFEMQDPKVFEGLKTAFPNLVRLGVDTQSQVYGREEESGIKLGAVLGQLGACVVGWTGLKFVELALPTYPEHVKDILLNMLEGKELYKGG